MIVPLDIAKRFNDATPYLKELAKRVEDVVFSFCKSKGYAYLGRVKDVESLAEKIESGRFTRWSALDDLFACSIVIPTLASEMDVLIFLQNEFEQVEVKNRGSSQKDPTTFRFDSTRFIGRLKSPTNDQQNEIHKLTFEIQIRSAFEHAWSVATHAIAYKSGQIDWKRIRLSSQLKAAVEQLDHLILGFDEAAKVINAQFWAETEAMRVIETAFKLHFSESRIPREIIPKSWQRFSENLYRLIRQTKGFDRRKPLEQVEKMLEEIANKIREQSGENFPRSISLMQFAVGCLSNQLIFKDASNYTLLVTSQLTDLFPNTKGMKDTFDFNG